MKDLSLFVSCATLVILFGYITYNGVQDPPEKDTISDEEVAQDKIDIEEDPQPAIAVSVNLPDSASFAGEPVPLNLPDVRERFDRELQINTYLHSSTLFIMKRAHRWLPRIDSILKMNGIPDDFKYMPLIESALLNDISSKDAVGFWQILKTSGREFGLDPA